MRATLISQLVSQVAFSFEPEGLVYLSGQRYFSDDGKMIFEYCNLTGFFERKFDQKTVSCKIVYLHESETVGFRNKQPIKDVFDVEVEQRKVLTEKNGDEMKKELKRINNDPLYFMVYYKQQYSLVRDIVICKTRRHR